MAKIIGLLLATLLSTHLLAAELQIVLQDAEGQPLSDAVLWISPSPAPTSAANDPLNALMDQQNRAFVPYVLAVQRGTTVRFPNSDPINHHVYSFSPAKRFELRLHHQGEGAQEVLFDHVGLVTLGCNVHDWMLGFILVIDSPWFVQTDVNGRARLHYNPAKGQQLNLWHPQLADAEANLARSLPTDGMARINLTQPLKRDPRPPVPRKSTSYKSRY
ncbi:MAG: methylamine utilization protein [Pseudomonas sp.]|uniref:methylamine utilization protein n=1 Tax=Pseudomonas sp. TaxID=306 RepID=UPI003BB500E7